MSFYPENEPIPGKLQTEDFVIQPLTPAHVELDYAALMSSKEMLRLWSGSPWPSTKFTLAENLGDLEWHWSEHQERIAFTFTVLNPEEDTCLGCIYIKPITEILTDTADWEVEPELAGKSNKIVISDYTALIRFWVVEPMLSQNLDKTLLHNLRQWFSTEWVFTEIYWHTPANNPQQINLFQTNGLQNVGTIQLPNRGGEHILFK